MQGGGKVRSRLGFFAGLKFEDIGEVMLVDSENFLDTIIMVTLPDTVLKINQKEGHKLASIKHKMFSKSARLM